MSLSAHDVALQTRNPTRLYQRAVGVLQCCSRRHSTHETTPRLCTPIRNRDFPDGAGDKESSCQRRRCKRRGRDPRVGKVPWRRAWHPTPVFSPGGPHGQRSLAGCGPRGGTESDMAEATAQHRIMNHQKQKLRKQPWGG